MDFEERLNYVELKIRDSSLKVDYYIFDYDPKEELKVREEIRKIKEKINNNPNYDFNIVEFDLYEIVLDILKSKGYLEKTFELEKRKGKNTRIKSNYIIRFNKYFRRFPSII